MRLILGVKVKHFRAPLARVIAIDRQMAMHRARYRGGMEKLEKLLDQYCWDAELDIATVRRRGGPRTIDAVRRAFVRRARKLGFSTTMIGAVLHRDHTSVLYLLK